MDGPVHDALARHYDQYTVGDRLHHVPPHVVYEVTVEGTRAVCKVATGPERDPAEEAAAMQFARGRTDLPIPEILASGTGHYVAAWAGNAPDESTARPTADRLGALARSLGRLHVATAGAFHAPGFVRVDDPLTVESPGGWRETLLALLDGYAGRLAAEGHADVAERVATAVAAHADVLDHADTPALLHGNLLPDHVSDDGGEPTFVIDFEHALVGPPEYDYLRTVVPVFLGARRGESALSRKEFRELYESIRTLPSGFGDRRSLHLAVLSVSYLQALYVQNPEEDAEGLDSRAESIREHVDAALDAADERLRSP